ncbi:M14 family metallopeptidase [Actinoplanes sp. N902-109]|uniref:M14 family metallopeptidase n=1 Tax=Actinoplanes sp. (strain N902-109) TaxID=649831 RepID=UPI0003294C07|nr:M14 family metallopeptidase [Actinoplanes sp. N902-109]AGL19706.1 peptidase M14 carboxypeptidase A [Actinoplanes sp. N902-109]
MSSARWATACALALTTAAAAVLTGFAPAAAAPPDDKLGVYVGTLDATQFDRLRAAGLDPDEIASADAGTGKRAVEIIVSPQQAAALTRAGVPLTAKRSTARMRAGAAAAPTVFRQYNTPGGIREELAAVAAANPRIAKLETLGTSLRGVPIQGVKLTRDARSVPDGKRPAVLYMGAQHAREWITPEMTRRLLHYFVDGYGKDPAITKLVNTDELWFVPVANVDGYDFTFTAGNRQWRKNLRDVNGDGVIGTGDGVDINRNFAERWGYDNEGSSDDPAGETYRGSAPQSEPETRAFDKLFKRVGFEFMVNYHSAAQLLLYGVGWQVETPSPDDEISVALAGDDAHSAVPGYDPDLSAELYTTNGETDGHAQVRYGTISFTPEMSTCATASNLDPDDRWNAADCESIFTFPDDEKLIEQEFEKNLPFALSVAGSAKDPANPVSSVGRSTPDLRIDPFDVSYGADQEVAVTAKRSLGKVTLHYSINGGKEKTGKAKEWRGGERYGGELDKYFAEMRGKVKNTDPGDKVKVWFTAGPATSASFTYTVNSKIGGDVLVLAAEDVTGVSPANTDGATSARYADEHVASLRKAGYRADVYDIDAHGGVAPHPLGVLSHYDAVVWETGDDIIPRVTGQPAGTVARAAVQTELAVRDYLNEGGKLLYAGKYAGYAEGTNGQYAYQPEGPGECTDPDSAACLPLLNDFQQYWLGAYSYVDGAGTAATGTTYPVTGTGGKFTGFTGTPGAGHTASFLTTSSFLPAEQFPQFKSSGPVDWQLPGAQPYDPYDGSYYLWSGQADSSYKRLTKTIDLTGASSARLKFNTSFDTEANWDFLFVEAHEVGTDNWTTLPDANGLTSTETGDSCPEGIAGLHPQVAHYQGADCSATGTTGSWNAATGNSGGWKEFDADLSAYAGKKVEVSISYMSDWGTQGLGVFVDNARVEAGGTVAEQTSFESDLGGWTVAGPPPGSGANSTDWSRKQQAFDSGAGIATADTVYLGFGLETLPAAQRDDLLRRALKHLKV